jgi:hypothetical protein
MAFTPATPAPERVDATGPGPSLSLPETSPRRGHPIAPQGRSVRRRQIQCDRAEAIDVNQARLLATQAGWGRIHVQRMAAEDSGYLAKCSLIAPGAPETLAPLGRIRRVGVDEGKGCGQKNLFSTIFRACKDWRGWSGHGNSFEIMGFARRMLFMTIRGAWRAGLVPGVKPCWMSSEEKLYLGEGSYGSTLCTPY